MIIKAKDLNDEQKEIFTEAFYEAWSNCEEFDEYEPDLTSVVPYGCPWFYNEELEINSLSLEESAGDYFYSMMDDIAEDYESAFAELAGQLKE